MSGTKIESVQVIDLSAIIVGRVLEQKDHPTLEQAAVDPPGRHRRRKGHPDHRRRAQRRRRHAGARSRCRARGCPAARSCATARSPARRRRGCSAPPTSCSLARSASPKIMLLDHGEPGESLAKYIPVDAIFEAEITPNRPDCLGHIGVARELAAAAGRDFKADFMPPVHRGRSAAGGRADRRRHRGARPVQPVRGGSDQRGEGRTEPGLGAAPPARRRRATHQQRGRRHRIRDARARQADARLRRRQARGQAASRPRGARWRVAAVPRRTDAHARPGNAGGRGRQWAGGDRRHHRRRGDRRLGLDHRRRSSSRPPGTGSTSAPRRALSACARRPRCATRRAWRRRWRWPAPGAPRRWSAIGPAARSTPTGSTSTREPQEPVRVQLEPRRGSTGCSASTVPPEESQRILRHLGLPGPRRATARGTSCRRCSASTSSCPRTSSRRSAASTASSRIPATLPGLAAHDLERRAARGPPNGCCARCCSAQASTRWSTPALVRAAPAAAARPGGRRPDAVQPDERRARHDADLAAAVAARGGALQPEPDRASGSTSSSWPASIAASSADGLADERSA